jgi:hypothetical protein
VFAARGFVAGEVVESCPTVELADADVTGQLGDYVFRSVRDGDVVLPLGHGVLYNHSADPNVDYVQDELSVITFVARRSIRSGDELTIDYGEEWWATRGLTAQVIAHRAKRQSRSLSCLFANGVRVPMQRLANAERNSAPPRRPTQAPRGCRRRRPERGGKRL